MSLNSELNSFLNTIVDSYAHETKDGFFINTKIMPMDEIVSEFAAIVIAHRDRPMECLYESKGFEDFVCSTIAFLQKESSENLEDLGDSLKAAMISYYESEFMELLYERLEYQYDMNMQNAGYFPDVDKDNGETIYVRL